MVSLSCPETNMDVLNALFEQHFHRPATRVVQLQGELGGSGRKIIRLSDGQQSAIGILHDVREENAAFLAFTRHFLKHGLPVPEIYGEDLDRGAYLELKSRNIMLLEGNAYFVDYQGGRKGALQYDIASLLYDAKADLPPELRQHLLDYYLDQLACFMAVDRDAFLRYYYGFVYVRIMQALGAYGFRGFYERKAHFLQSVPYALKNLRWLLHNVKLPIALPTLLDAFNSMLGSEKLQGLATSAETLTVRIFSFSFHRGWPKDETGNGGGFVFDGRSLPNPGREERFKPLTGRDAPVIEYLNQQESVHQFFASALSLVDASIQEYQRRGFRHLMVAFGCTGGQHRSVYLAEQLAKRLRARNGVNVVLHHRELESRAE